MGGFYVALEWDVSWYGISSGEHPWEDHLSMSEIYPLGSSELHFQVAVYPKQNMHIVCVCVCV